MLRLYTFLLLLFSSSLAHASIGQYLYESNRSMEAWRANLEKQSINVGKDHWVYYSRNLQRDTCIILVHGFTAEAAHWFRFARQLKPDECIIIPDLPGFGESSYDAAGDYSIPQQAQRLNAFLTQVKPDSQLHLVGSSMGGHIVTTYALNYPQPVASLTLFNAGGVVAAEKSYARKFFESNGKPIFFIDNRADFYHLKQHSMSAPPWMPGIVLDYLADQFIGRNARHMHIFSEIENQDRIDDRLHEIRVPTLVIWGAKDKILDKTMGERYASRIKDAVHHVMPTIGHVPFLEAPAQSAAVMTEFLQR